MMISRRTFLRYTGAGTAAFVAGCTGSPALLRLQPSPDSPTRRNGADVAASHGWPGRGGPEERAAYPDSFVEYPLPLSRNSSAPEFVDVHDTLTLPEGFELDVLASAGDVFGPAGQSIVFGYNCDHNELVPVAGTRDEFWLVVNHEYVSARPWFQGFEAMYGREAPAIRLLPDAAAATDEDRGRLVIGSVTFPTHILDPSQAAYASLTQASLAEVRDLCDLHLDAVGISILHLKRHADRFEVLRQSRRHKRIHGARTVNVPEAFAPRLTGPVSVLVSTAHGTLANCAGGKTPWGTTLTCEENVQDVLGETVTPAGAVFETAKLVAKKSHPALDRPMYFEGVGAHASVVLDPRAYGWVGEIDPETGRMLKHTALGKFRHENVSLRAVDAQPLAAYMGDDRRGGHVWRYVSRDVVVDRTNPATSRLLEDGLLSVARFTPDFSGEWIALLPDTRLRRPEPEATAAGHLWLPRRPEGGLVSIGRKRPGGSAENTVDEWIRQVEAFAGKSFEAMTLGDLVRPGAPEDMLAVILLDAFAMANAVGGTPCARPEDIEIHPLDGSIYIAFTDCASRSEGSPDIRIFPSAYNSSPQGYGALYRIQDGDARSTCFNWGVFVPSGEVASGGAGFAAADNLVFDSYGNLWMVCDVAPEVLQHPVARVGDTAPGTRKFAGVFGNNALFFIAPDAHGLSMPRCFAIGPMECELTGPVWSDDESILILSVQHPGEWNGTRDLEGSGLVSSELRDYAILGGDGAVRMQRRNVPIGSNFPHAVAGSVPLPCVVQIRPKA